MEWIPIPCHEWYLLAHASGCSSRPGLPVAWKQRHVYVTTCFRICRSIHLPHVLPSCNLARAPSFRLDSSLLRLCFRRLSSLRQEGCMAVVPAMDRYVCHCTRRFRHGLASAGPEIDLGPDTGHVSTLRGVVPCLRLAPWIHVISFPPIGRGHEVT